MSGTPVDLETLAALPRYARLMGLDMGAKTIGVSLSDVERIIASPLKTILRTKFTKDVRELSELIARHGVGGIVLGLPRNMDGSEGPAAQSARSFARNLAPLISLPLAFWDERLSTAAVTRTLIEADRSRARRNLLVDKLAATYILQGALDRLNSLGERPP
ncbi:MAG: Holliday junction resolvase RuvX, partial [Hyphomicrobiales bacterium]|nr:Holliday junction resolvase RuvX [Hyphomicrobiales bacterium]